MENTIRKIWGTRSRILLTDQTEIDLLDLEPNSACSVHNHEHKYNRFLLLSGDVRIRTDLGETKLKIGEPFDVEPEIFHQFIVKKKSKMIELAFVKKGKIDLRDIYRVQQGGKFVDGKFYTLDELKHTNWEEYSDVK